MSNLVRPSCVNEKEGKEGAVIDSDCTTAASF